MRPHNNIIEFQHVTPDTFHGNHSIPVLKYAFNIRNVPRVTVARFGHKMTGWIIAFEMPSNLHCSRR